MLVYGYMFTVSKTYDIPFLPWASATLFWTAAMCALLALFNTCAYIHHFTRFSGELFGLLIAILFLQQAVKGLMSEFQPPGAIAGHRRAEVDLDEPSNQPSWLLFNGAFALFLACGLLGTSLVSVTARGWNLFNGIVRRIIADYGTALCVLMWTLVSLAPRNTPEGIPRRLVIANTFEGSENYSILSRMHELEGWHIAAAMVPGFIIAVLFFFDHNVSSQLAQEGLFLKKPSAYHWDLMLLAIMTTICGVLGLPPVNGVIPQAPMHSRANTVWREEARTETHGHCEDAAPNTIHDDAHGGRNFYIRENRLSNLLQSLLCGVCLLITPVLAQIPRSVLWGFFAFMAVEGLPGNQFWKRLLLYMTDSTCLHKLTEVPGHDSYLDKVPMNVIFKFTACQFAGLLICYGITWAGIAGISFPLFIMALVPVREFLMPRIFADEHLQELDPLHLSHKNPSTPELELHSSTNVGKDAGPDQARNPEQEVQVLQDRKQLDDLEALVSKLRTENETANEELAEVKAEALQQARSAQKVLEEAMMSRADRDAAGKGGNQVSTPGAGGGERVCGAIYASGVPDVLDPLQEGIVKFSIDGGKILHTTSLSSRGQDCSSLLPDFSFARASELSHARGKTQVLVEPDREAVARLAALLLEAADTTPHGGSSGEDEAAGDEAAHHQAALAVPRQGMGENMGELEGREPPRIISAQEMEQISDIQNC